MKHILYLTLLVVMLSPTAAFATFNDIGVGARPLGLGGAFVALADDSNAANYNAAGLGYISEIHLGVTHAQRFNGLITYNNISGVIPFGRAGSIGASLGVLGEDSEIYREQTVRVSYGNALFKQLAIGANLKLFGISFDAANEFVAENQYFAQTSSSAVSLDVGVIAKPFQSLSLGVSAENLLPADMSISETNTGSVPLNIRAGLAYRLESIAEMSAQGAAVSNLLKGTVGTVEITRRNGETYELQCPDDEENEKIDIPVGCGNGEETYEVVSPSQIHIRAGIEVWLNKSIAVRGGYGIKNGSNSATALNFGGSAKVPIGGTALQLDYGIQLLSGNFQDNTTQRFSLNLLF